MESAKDPFGGCCEMALEENALIGRNSLDEDARGDERAWIANLRDMMWCMSCMSWMRR